MKSVINLKRFIYLFHGLSTLKCIKNNTIVLLLIVPYSFSPANAELPSSETNNIGEVKWTKTDFHLINGVHLNYLIYNASISLICVLRF